MVSPHSRPKADAHAAPAAGTGLGDGVDLAAARPGGQLCERRRGRRASHPVTGASVALYASVARDAPKPPTDIRSSGPKRTLSRLSGGLHTVSSVYRRETLWDGLY